ncbi:MAG: nitrous oxide reductase accessory protein NosL [Amphritea sp.]
MGSFSKQADAEAFAESEGGRVLTFEEITLDVLISMNSMQTHVPDTTTAQ